MCIFFQICLLYTSLSSLKYGSIFKFLYFRTFSRNFRQQIIGLTPRCAAYGYAAYTMYPEAARLEWAKKRCFPLSGSRTSSEWPISFSKRCRHWFSLRFLATWPSWQHRMNGSLSRESRHFMKTPLTICVGLQLILFFICCFLPVNLHVNLLAHAATGAVYSNFGCMHTGVQPGWLEVCVK